MNEHHEVDNEQHTINVAADPLLEAHVTQVLYKQAEEVHFTPALQERIIQQLPPRRTQRLNHLRVLVLTSATALVLALSLTTYLLLAPKPAPPPIHYVMAKTIDTPAELANGGRLIALDPTEQHFVYQPADQPGVLYTADLTNPVATNFLAMRYARDVAWAPDGSALVATVLPEGTFQPLLALVPTGKYMHLLGHDALAASWLPTSTQQITYVTQSGSQTYLWTTTPEGHSPSQPLAKMDLAFLAQRLIWSRDGQMLAIIVTTSSTLSETALNQPGRAVYVMDARTNLVQKVVSPGNSRIGAVAWSPDRHYLTYEQTDAQGNTTLQTIGMEKQYRSFAITIRQKLLGWSWSPDSRALVYSDGGVLSAHTLRGPAIQFPQSQAIQIFPFWLKDGQILYLGITHGVGKLALLKQSPA